MGMENGSNLQPQLSGGGQQSFGAPPPSRGWASKVLGTIGGLTGVGLVFMGLLYFFDWALPPDMKPSTRVGAMAGNIERSEMAAKQQQAIDYNAQMANAGTAPNANWQMEAEAARKQLEITAQGLQMQAGIANLADAACMASPFITGFFGNSPDVRQWAETMRQGCGAGQAIRQGINQEIALTVRNNSALMQRSAPQNQPAFNGRDTRTLPASQR